MAAPIQRGFLGLVTAESSRLLSTMDDLTIAQRLVALPTSGLLMSCSFETAASAMCWLTDPVPADVVQAVHQSGVLPAPPSEGGGGRWLAIFARGLSSCLDLRSSGTGGAVMLMKQSVSPLCAVGRFAAADDAHRWLASSATADLLQLLSDTVDAAIGPSELRHDAGPPGVAASALVAHQASEALQQSAQPPWGDHCEGPLHRRRQGGPVPAKDKPVCDRSPLAVWSAQAAAEVDASSGEGLSTTAGSPSARSSVRGPPSVHGTGTSGKPPRAFGRASSMSDAGSSCAQSSGRAGTGSRGRVSRGKSRAAAERGTANYLPLPRPCPVALAVTAGVCGADGRDDGTDEAECGAPSLRAPSVVGGKPAKKMRLVESGSVPSFLNPSGAGYADSRTTFSRAGISRMMAETKRAWEKSDADRARAVAAAAAAAQRALPSALPTLWTASRTCTVQAGPTPVRDVVIAPADSRSVQQPPCAETATVRDRDDAEGGLPSPAIGPLGQLAASGHWAPLLHTLAESGHCTFVTGGPGVGKSTFLRCFHKKLLDKWALPGEVVVVAPTGSAAKTANGQTYHSFFGFPRNYVVKMPDPVDEAARLLKEERFRFISRRLATVRALLIDEVSMVPADRFDIIVQLLRQSRSASSPPCLIYTFGDFLQLGPPGGGALAFTSRSWPVLFGNSMLELTKVHRQADTDFIRAINDARYGVCSMAVTALMEERSVTDEQYEALRCSVLHLMPHHDIVEKHNRDCLAKLCRGSEPMKFAAVDTIEQDKDREQALPSVDLSRVSEHSRNAALVDCVAPRSVQHTLGARVMLINNQYLALGLYHGSIGRVSSYKDDGTPVVRFDHHALPNGSGRGMHGVHDAGEDWLEVECPPVAFEARLMAHPGAVEVRRQVPFVLGWGITVHRSQSLSLSDAVLDIGQAFGPGMVNAAISRVSDRKRMHVRSFMGSRLFADPVALNFYRSGRRL